MFDARAVANFFIDRSLSKGPPVTLMTLLKALYFSHAWHLVQFNAPLIAQPFEAWKYGPVIRVIYDQFKGVGSKTLCTKAQSLDVASATFGPTPYEFEATTKEYLGNIFDYYAAFHPFKLSDLTHEEDGPWETIWKEAERRAVLGMIIPNELIFTWFSTRGALDWTYHEQIRAS
jgi:uncharacterized phage-associated protein